MEKKTTLYDISESILNITELLDEDNSEQFEEILTKLDMKFEEKAENIAKYLQDLQGDVDKIKNEEKRLFDKRKAIENKVSRLKDYLKYEMEKLDKKKFKTDLFSFNIQKNPPSLIVEHEDIIPEYFWINERRLQKSELSKAVKDGLELDGVYFKQGESLRIR